MDVQEIAAIALPKLMAGMTFLLPPPYILPAQFAQDAQFKSRFEREAKTISPLNHPHICTLYDVGDNSWSWSCLRERLADRLERGALPLADVLKHGAQIVCAERKS